MVAPYVFDAPVQRLRAGDRILRSPVPELALRTVIFVQTARHPGGSPLPFAPVAVVLAPEGPVSSVAMLREVPDNPDTAAEELIAPGIEEEPVRVGWGTRLVIERIPEPDEVYHVSAREPLAKGARLTVQVTSELELVPDEWPNAFPGEAPEAGAVIGELVAPAPASDYPVSAIDAANLRGEVIDAYWYVDGHRVETPNEQSAREAADIFAGHVVRLHPAGMDAGETCPRCRRVISWSDHLPPTASGQFVRCTARAPRVLP